MVFLLLVARAFAAEPSPAPAGETVTVEGDAVSRARVAVEEQLRTEGYHPFRRDGEFLVYRSSVAWRPDVWIHDDGWMLVRRQTPSVQGPAQQWANAVAIQKDALIAADDLRPGAPRLLEDGETGEPSGPDAGGQASLCLATKAKGEEGIRRKAFSTACLSLDGVFVAKRHYVGAADQLRSDLHDVVNTLGEAVSLAAMEERVNVEIPALLDAIWADPGVPAVERRARLYTWWDERTDTAEGDLAKAAARAFLIGVVQSSGDPYTPAELAALNERRSSLRALELPFPIR